MTTIAAPAPFTYYGGKQRLAAELVGLLPDSQVFVDVFGGSGAVLLARPPRNDRLDVYNDADDAVVTFFRVLRDRPAELVRALRLTPYSRTEFEVARDTLDSGDLDELEVARRFYVRVSQAYAASPATSGWGGQRRGGSRVVRPITVRDHVDDLELVADRLRAVQVDHLDWRSCLDRYDAVTATLYLDPPYVHETRGNGGSGERAYRLELSTDDHVELVDRLLELESSWLLSGYAHGVYSRLDAVAERFEYVQRVTSSRTNVKPATEVVWRRLAAGVNVQQRLVV